jgi:hypothetical protein
MPNAIDTASKLLSGTAAPRRWRRRSHHVVERLGVGALAPDAEHVGIDVGDGRARAGPAGRDRAERDIPGAARDVEQCELSVRFRRIDRCDQRVLPGAMQPGRHQVVHQVVALRHLVEHVVDQRLLLAERHLAKPKWVLSRMTTT